MWLHVHGCGPSHCAAVSSDSNAGSSAPSPDGLSLWALSSGKPTLQPLSWRGWKKRPWLRFLSGTISRPSLAATGVAQWISSLQDSLANPPASPESAPAPSTSDGSGHTSTARSSTVTRRCCSSRTCQGCSPSTTVRPSRRSSNAWPRAGGLQSGIAFPRQPSAPRTFEIASTCSLPTPTASTYGSSQNGINGKGGAFERPSAGTSSLFTMARTGQLDKLAMRTLIPTATATATDAKASGVTGNWDKTKAAATSGRHSGTTLTDFAVRAGTDGQRSSEGRILNPRFVEWMMGASDNWSRIDGAGEWSDRIHALGNGVVEHGAAFALGVLLERISTDGV